MWTKNTIQAMIVAIELKKALNKSQPRSNPNMSEAEQKLKFPNKKS
ncbi:hypothetical protein [Neobacillus sp. SuZ13]|nr:hypothetical protein [Neobacillus sp. SuZ13]WHY65153.1 hypothetical protein QNH17_18790 [Neobacillus sp. SuZ13]